MEKARESVPTAGGGEVVGLDLPGPSRRITVEPLRLPEPVRREPPPPDPAEPGPEPTREPAEAPPAREPEPAQP